jgi:hypothetical protein
MTHSGMTVRLTPGDKHRCSACPEAWFTIPFDTQFDGGTQGVYVQLDDGSFVHLDIEYGDVLAAGFPESRVYEVGRDGYYLTMDEARRAIPAPVHGVHYVDDFNTEFQDFFVVCDDDDHTPYAEAHVAELIR